MLCAMCRYFYKNYGINVKEVRIFPTYGEGLHKQIFGAMYNKATDTGKLEVFDTGKESWDYFHMDDVV